MSCYKITTITNTGSALNLTLPKTSLTVKNGERACFQICTSLPVTNVVLPVNFAIGSTTVPLYDLLGNQLYSDQLCTCVRIPGVWGTNPLHFKLCSCVNGRSQTTPATTTIPTATASSQVSKGVSA